MVLPSISEGGSADLWALLVQPPEASTNPSLVLSKQGDELVPILCDPSPTLPRLARLSSAMASVGVVVDPSSWLFVGWTPGGDELWSAAPGLWIQPPPAHLLSLSFTTLSDVVAHGLVVSSPLPTPLGEPSEPPQGCSLSMSSWLSSLFVALGLMRDPLRQSRD